MEIEITEDSIGIYQSGQEIVYWCLDEWKEDPTVVISIANAITLALTEPEKLRKLLRR